MRMYNIFAALRSPVLPVLFARIPVLWARIEHASVDDQCACHGGGRGGEGRGGGGGDLVEEEDVGRALGDVGEDEARLLACSCVMKDA